MRILRSFTLSALCVTLALLLTLHIPFLRENFKFLLFWCAVLASATRGTWPGVFATFLGVALADYFLVPPPHASVIFNPTEQARALLYCGGSLATVWVIRRIKLA